MKLFLFGMFFLCFCLNATAQPDTLTTKINAVVDTALNNRLAPLQQKITSTDSTAKHLSDTVKGILEGHIVIDSAALAWARKDPVHQLYSNYFFSKTNEFLPWLYFILSLLLLIAMWWVGVYQAKNGALLKDESFDANGNRMAAKDSPYSYARTQLFWWTMIILSCYVCFFGLTGVLLPINATAALLLGCGVVVYGAGKIIDQRQIADNKGLRAQDASMTKAKPDFFSDILSDENGVSIHRFQALIFNVVFGIGFIGFFIKGIDKIIYPFADFTDWQFTLLGISSVTYLGLKAGENQNLNTGANPSPQNNTVNAEEAAPRKLSNF